MNALKVEARLGRRLATAQFGLAALLLMMALYGFELSASTQRALWLLVCTAAAVGVFIKPLQAAVVGWLLLIVVVCYLAVTSWLGEASGSGWIVLFVLPWLPLAASNVTAQVAALSEQLRLHHALRAAEVEPNVHTGLPGLGIARLCFPAVRAAHARARHASGLVLLTCANLELIRELADEHEYRELLTKAAQAVRETLRGSDWLFHVRDDQFLVIADLGEQTDPAALLSRVLLNLQHLPRFGFTGASRAVTEPGAEVAAILESFVGSGYPALSAPTPSQPRRSRRSRSSAA